MDTVHLQKHKISATGKYISLDYQLGTFCREEFSHAYSDKHNHKTAHLPWNFFSPLK